MIYILGFKKITSLYSILPFRSLISLQFSRKHSGISGLLSRIHCLPGLSLLGSRRSWLTLGGHVVWGLVGRYKAQDRFKVKSTCDGLNRTLDPAGVCHPGHCWQHASRSAADDRATFTHMQVGAGKQQKAKRTTNGDQLSYSPQLQWRFPDLSSGVGLGHRKGAFAFSAGFGSSLCSLCPGGGRGWEERVL